jgi:two-component system sensor histidine kinase KdpD
LAEQLGAETHILIGDNVADTLVKYAHSRNVTKVIVGKTAQPWYRRLFTGTVVDGLLERSGDIDVYVIRGEGEASTPKTHQPTSDRRSISWPRYFGTAGVVALCAGLGWLCHWSRLAEANVVMVFLLGVAVVASRFGRGPAIVAAVANVLVFDFLFVPPNFSFTFNDAQYVLTFGVMLGIGLLISHLTSRVRERLRASQQQEQRTAALFRLTRQLSEVAGSEFLIQTAGQQLAEIFAGDVLLYSRGANGVVALRFGEETQAARHEINGLVAQWVADHGRSAGAGTDTLPNATALFVPVIGSQRTVGALGVRPGDAQRFLDPEQRRLLDTCASLIALSIERDQSVLDAAESRLQAEAEQMRSSLLSSVSHDLRTPLAAIAGAASSLLEAPPADNLPTRAELLHGIVDESRRLTRLVDNLLEMTRLESGTATPSRQWHVLEEIIGSALARLRNELRQHTVTVEVPTDLPLVFVDGLLMEQVLVNLLDNAVRYTPSGSRIELTATGLPDHIEIRLRDNGPGLPIGSEARLFDKFTRGPNPTTDGRRGVGLGLAICRAVVEAHKGKIRAVNHPAGGAEFIINLPREQPPPQVSLDEMPSSR